MANPKELYAFDLPVDTATILIADKEWLTDYAELRHAQTFKVETGKYNAHILVSGPQRRTLDRVFVVTSGEVWIGDPCQMVKNSLWEQFLDMTRYFKIPSRQAVFVKMYSDGGYSVRVDLTVA